MKSLMRSRKFWLAVFAMVQTVVFSLMPNFDAAVWGSIDVVVMMLIWSIAREDAAEKSAPVTYNVKLGEDGDLLPVSNLSEVEA